MLITIDPADSTAPYEQVRRQIAAQIWDRRLPVGTRLPPIRRLASDLGLAANTVARAYRELEIAELVETRGRNGTFVLPSGEHPLDRLHAAADRYALFAMELGADATEATEAAEKAVMRTWAADQQADPDGQP